MVNAKIYYGEDCLAARLSGHAGFAPKGQDIVCAGISSLTMALTGTVNQSLDLSSVTHFETNFSDGKFFIFVKGISDPELKGAVRALFIMFHTGLMKIEDSYPGHLSVKSFNLPSGDDYNDTSEQTMKTE